ncbi:hypothetical protein Cni_G10363 [Canna indica]|uniref:Uncharacterized protein n=1 Tax=Canna indica TaxID=4628 RepID=A0AAQ3K9R9_9LILI|nr:hypothetical protein Cni_G10363 [Canna indica]
MGRKLDLLLGRTSRQMQELKSLLSLAVSRLAVLRHRRQVRCDQARGDVAQLLQLGHVDRALLHVEYVIKEQNMLDVFAMLEHYCHLLEERAVLLDQKHCPEELREAIASLIFAASRCAELPELEKIRGIFSSKYGREFVSAAVELRNDCRVNPKMIQKLSTRQPSLDIRQRVTTEIAAEKGIKLDFCDPSQIAEGGSVESSAMYALHEQFGSGENSPVKSHGHQKYKDVAGAAQAAFESAALAAEAARAAVELCRFDSQGKGSDDEDKAGSQRRREVKEFKTNMVESSADSKILEEFNHDQKQGSDSEETKAKKNDSLRNEVREHGGTPSSSDFSDEEDDMNLSEKLSTGFGGKNTNDTSDDETKRSKRVWGLGSVPVYGSNEELTPPGKDKPSVRVQFDASIEDGSPTKHPSSYLRPPYRRRKETRQGERHSNAFYEETNKVGLRSETQGKNSIYDNADSVDEMQFSSGKKPISVRTRRGY